MSCASCCAHDIACHAVVTVNTTAQQHHASDQNGERTPSSQGLAQTNPPTPDVDIPTKSATSHHAPQEHKQNQESVQKRGPLHGIWVLSPRMTLLVAHEVRAGGFGRVRRLFRAVGSGFVALYDRDGNWSGTVNAADSCSESRRESCIGRSSVQRSTTR